MSHPSSGRCGYRLEALHSNALYTPQEEWRLQRTHRAYKYIYIHHIYILRYWILLTRNVVQDVQGDVAAPSLLCSLALPVRPPEHIAQRKLTPDEKVSHLIVWFWKHVSCFRPTWGDQPSCFLIFRWVEDVEAVEAASWWLVCDWFGVNDDMFGNLVMLQGAQVQSGQVVIGIGWWMLRAKELLIVFRAPCDQIEP